MVHSYGSDTVKGIVDFINSNSIPNSKIVTIMEQASGTVTLIYFD